MVCGRRGGGGACSSDKESFPVWYRGKNGVMYKGKHTNIDDTWGFTAVTMLIFFLAHFGHYLFVRKKICM